MSRRGSAERPHRARPLPSSTGGAESSLDSAFLVEGPVWSQPPRPGPFLPPQPRTGRKTKAQIPHPSLRNPALVGKRGRHWRRPRLSAPTTTQDGNPDDRSERAHPRGGGRGQPGGAHRPGRACPSPRRPRTSGAGRPGHDARRRRSHPGHGVSGEDRGRPSAGQDGPGPLRRDPPRDQPPFGAPGFVARATTACAEAGVNVFVLSTYSFDYVLVPEPDRQAALDALTRAGFPGSTPPPSG